MATKGKTTKTTAAKTTAKPTVTKTTAPEKETPEETKVKKVKVLSPEEWIKQQNIDVLCHASTGINIDGKYIAEYGLKLGKEEREELRNELLELRHKIAFTQTEE